MMMVFRCNICGDPYVGYERPKNCPFCGAHEEFMHDAKEWVDKNKIDELSEVSRKNLEKALEIELSNSAFYRCAAEHSNDIICQSMFKALAKIEAEHATVISKLLSIPKPDPSIIEVQCNRGDLLNIEESSSREANASAFYHQAAKEADEPRIKEVFSELVKIEKDHLELDRIQKERLSRLGIT